MSASDTKPVGDIVAYRVSYSVSYAQSDDTVVWIDMAESGITSSYGQDTDFEFIEASHGGQICTTSPSCNVGGVVVPENAIYYNLGDVAAGTAGTLAFRVRSKNGLQDGIVYTANGHIANATNAEQVDAIATTTELTATPYPSVDKKVGGVIAMQSNNHVFDDGSTYTPNVTYSIEVTNNAKYYGVGHETIFNPQITDDLSDIDTKLEAFCSVTDGMDRVTAISNGGTISGTNIIWDSTDLSDMAPGASQVVTYQVDYTGCPDDITRIYNNTATLSADNISDLSDAEAIVMGLDISPTGIFAKGDRVYGDIAVSGGDDNSDIVQPHEDIFSYIIRAANGGVVRLDDVVSIDELPADVTLIGASAPVGTIYYSDSAVQPAVSVTSHIGATGGIDTASGWSTIPTTSARWIAWYVPCVNSAFFPSAECSYDGETGASILDLEIQVQLNTPPNVCAVYDVENTVNFDVYSASSSITNTNTDIDTSGTITDTAVISASDTELTHVEPPIGDISVESTIVGPDEIQIGDNGTYILTVKNSGADSVQDVSVRIPLPELTVNGVPNQNIGFVSASGGTVDTS